ncbi:hypothetical protein [Mucilaginibacter terrae]|uniref:Uncharacterized protein n=1 Tax=Mucilaginibacter terrae TaxID=1955052 RepID=A0ABU3GNE2_9SPHI|nr:hypothetical protein [Mucilaginibacter terrae]MDT3401289.1 hypothetical protein [Mucilaginibacter terrae]
MDVGSDYYGPFPVLELDGTQFLIDAFRHELIELGNETNRMDWYHDMLYRNDHVELLYDSHTKNVFAGDRSRLPDHVKLYWLYPLDALDPDATRARLDRVVPGWEENFPRDLPIVQIAGQDFFADARRKEFRDTENPWKSIPFSEVLLVDGNPGIYLDTRVMQVPFPHIFNPFEQPECLPEHIVFAAVPDARALALLVSDQYTFHYTGSFSGEQSAGRFSR